MSMRKTLVATAVTAAAVLGSAGTAFASGAGAVGGASDSPGLLSGNVVQVPINVPVNVCGDDISILAALTSADGNTCVNR